MKIEEYQFPSSWRLGPIADAFDFTSKPRGLDLSKNGENIPFFPMDRIPLGRIHVSDFTPKPIGKLGGGTYVEKGDIIVAKITPSFENGKQAIVDIENDFAYATTEVIPMRGRAGVSDTLFLFFFLLHPGVRSDLAGKMEGSTGRQRLGKIVLGDCLIPLPPLPEQKKIAHILSTVQRAIEAQERIIQTTTELFRSLLHQLMTEQIKVSNNQEQSMQDWKTCGFPESLAKNKIGRNNQVPTKNISKSGRFPVIDQGKKFIAGYCDDENKVIEFDLPLVIFGDHTRCFKYVDFPFVLGADGTKILQPKKELYNPRFYYFALLALDLPSRGYNRHFKLLKENTLPLPPLAEQEKIACILASAHGKIDNARAKQRGLNMIFRTLLHELMTANIRVHELDCV